MNELIKINAKDYGLTETKAAEVSAMFQPMLDKMVELEDKYNKITRLEISKDTCKQAKELRLQYVKIRTTTAKIHKELKQFYLSGGRFVDGWKNAQLMASQGIEKSLMNIEKHYENIELKRIKELQEKRLSEISLYVEFPDQYSSGLGGMTEAVYKNFLEGLKLAHTQRMDAIKKAEEEQIKKDKIDKLHNKRKKMLMPYYQFWTAKMIDANFGEISELIFAKTMKFVMDAKTKYDKEQEQIKQENERLQKKAKIENEKRKKLKEEYENKLIEQQKKAAIEQANAKKKFEEILKNDEEKKLKAEADYKAAQEKLKAKIEIDEKLKIRLIQQELNALSDNDKKTKLINDLNSLKKKYSFKEEDNQKLFAIIQKGLDKLIVILTK